MCYCDVYVYLLVDGEGHWWVLLCIVNSSFSPKKWSIFVRASNIVWNEDKVRTYIFLINN